MSRLDNIYLGIIDKVIPPGDPSNTTQFFQYQYSVLVTGDYQAIFPVICSVMSPVAGRDKVEESILSTGLRVFVVFPSGGSPACGLIIGCARQYIKPQDITRGKYWERRYNLITETIASDNTWQVKHDLGMFMKVEGQKITVSDLGGNSVVINAGLPGGLAGGSIDVNCNALNITVKGDASIKATGAVSVIAKDVSVKATTVDVKSISMTATVLKDVSLTAGTVDVQAVSINLNSYTGGMVLTTMSQPVCYVTGIPFVGTPLVKAG